MNKFYTIWHEFWGGDEQMLVYPDNDGYGYDDSISNVKAVFYTLQKAKEICVMIDEYVKASDGTVVYRGEWIINQDNGDIVKYTDVPKETLNKWGR